MDGELRLVSGGGQPVHLHKQNVNPLSKQPPGHISGRAASVSSAPSELPSEFTVSPLNLEPLKQQGIGGTTIDKSRPPVQEEAKHADEAASPRLGKKPSRISKEAVSTIRRSGPSSPKNLDRRFRGVADYKREGHSQVQEFRQQLKIEKAAVEEKAKSKNQAKERFLQLKEAQLTERNYGNDLGRAIISLNYILNHPKCDQLINEYNSKNPNAKPITKEDLMNNRDELKNLQAKSNALLKKMNEIAGDDIYETTKLPELKSKLGNEINSEEDIKNIDSKILACATSKEQADAIDAGGHFVSTQMEASVRIGNFFDFLTEQSKNKDNNLSANFLNPNNQSMQDYQAMPMQRITRYTILVGNQTEGTTLNKEQQGQINNNVKNRVDRINARIKEQEDFATSRDSSVYSTLEKEVFSRSNANIKQSFVELYTSESVFLDKLRALRGDKSLSSKDKKYLEALINNTKEILSSLETFNQLGVKQESELRTLRQDFSNAVAFQSKQTNISRKEAEFLNSIVTSQGEAGRLKGLMSFEKDETKKAELNAQIKEIEKSIGIAVELLSSSRNKNIISIVKQYNRIQTLESQLKNLPQVPQGVIGNLLNTMNEQRMEKQYKLLTHFKLKQDKMMENGGPNYSKYQEIGNKISRYPMMIGAMNKAMSGEELGALSPLKTMLERQAMISNNTTIKQKVNSNKT